MAILAAVILFIIAVVLGYFLLKVTRQFSEYKAGESSRREEAIKASRRVLGGKFTEQMVPYLPEFRYDPTEARFIGNPIDLVVFPGLATDNPQEIVLIEVKSGKSDSLTPREQRICELIEAGRARWELIYCPQAEE